MFCSFSSSLIYLICTVCVSTSIWELIFESRVDVKIYMIYPYDRTFNYLWTNTSLDESKNESSFEFFDNFKQNINFIISFTIFQTEIAKRLNALISQLLPCLQGEHQQQVLQAVERAKQVTVPELNAIIGVSVVNL